MAVSIMGLIGGILGFLMTPLNFFVGGIVVLLTAGTFSQLLILTGIGTIMSVTGIIGAVVSGGHRRTGGLMMFLSEVVPLIVATVVMASVNAWTAILVLYAFYFWTFILILSGLISLFKRGSPPIPHTMALVPGAA